MSVSTSQYLSSGGDEYIYSTEHFIHLSLGRHIGFAASIHLSDCPVSPLSPAMTFH
jgi:hypothetical protein